MVILMHGIFSGKDKNPVNACSDRYKETYGDQAELTVIDGENHRITRRRSEVERRVVEFFKVL